MNCVLGSINNSNVWRLTYCEHGERTRKGYRLHPSWMQPSHSIAQMLFLCLFVFLFGTVNHLSPGGGGWGIGSGHFFFSQNEIYQTPHPYTLLAKIYPTSLPPERRKIPLFGKIPLPHRRYIDSARFTFPLSLYFIQTGIFTTFLDAINIKVVPIDKQHLLFGDIKFYWLMLITSLTKITKKFFITGVTQ